METKIYKGIVVMTDDINAKSKSQSFYRIDEEHAVGDDYCVYQIVHIEELFNEDGDFIGDIKPILIYKDGDVALNYAEDGEISSYISKLLNQSEIFLDEDMVDNGKFKIYIDNFDDESILNIYKSINENMKEADIEKEFLFILENAIGRIIKANF